MLETIPMKLVLLYVTKSLLCIIAFFVSFLFDCSVIRKGETSLTLERIYEEVKTSTIGLLISFPILTVGL